MHPEITPLILTKNEEANIARVLERVRGAAQVVIVDSYSDDRTLDIAALYPHVRTVQRAFDGHEHQWNFGLDQVTTSWVLALDADYVPSEELLADLDAEPGTDGSSGYIAKFRYFIAGRPLRRSLYPAKVVLFRVRDGRYVADGHTQALRLDGTTRTLHGHIAHDDRKPLDRWLTSQRRYARLEARKLLTSEGRLSRADRLRRTGWIVPLLMPWYVLFVQGLLLDGTFGVFYALQRAYAELLLALELWDARLADDVAGIDREPRAADSLGVRADVPSLHSPDMQRRAGQRS